MDRQLLFVVEIFPIIFTLHFGGKIVGAHIAPRILFNYYTAQSSITPSVAISSNTMRKRCSNPHQSSNSKIPPFQNRSAMSCNPTCSSLNFDSKLSCESCKSQTNIFCKVSSSKKIKFRHLSDRRRYDQ